MKQQKGRSIMGWNKPGPKPAINSDYFFSAVQDVFTVLRHYVLNKKG